MLDLHSRQVVGWSLQAHMQTSPVKDALLMACFRRRPAAGLIFHSDRGSQYCIQDFQDTLKAWAARSSMSRKGNCWDNAPTESLWGRLKTACVHGQRFVTREQARRAIMDWIAFYNHSRLIRRWATSARCSSNNAGWRRSENLPLEDRAMHSGFQGQPHCEGGSWQGETAQVLSVNKGVAGF